MSTGGVTFSDRQGNRIGSLSATTVLTWLTIVAPLVLIAERTVAAAPGTPWWPAIVIVLLGVASADSPDSSFPFVTVGVAVAWWVAVTEHPSLGSTLVVALALLVFHIATGHAAIGPRGRDDDVEVVRAVVRRTTTVAGLTLVLAAIAAAASDRVVVPAAVLGLALVAAGSLPWVAGRWLRPGAGH
ncbi:MAG: hypothetical protein NTX33_17165 [Propionibacteriales bacterium]|nr:hypothetical protein [Propionibacteriales bacterium]